MAEAGEREGLHENERAAIAQFMAAVRAKFGGRLLKAFLLRLEGQR